MKKQIIITIAIIISFVGLLFLLVNRDLSSNPSAADTIHAASAETGNIPEKIIGDPNTAKVILYEYADYGCSHCADWNTEVNKLLEKYGNDLALVYRGYNLGFQNGPAAARAATAAQLQGYWKEYKDLLFANQAEWAYTEASKLEDLFVSYFNTASNGQGDAEQFRADLTSSAVATKNAFEHRLGEMLKLSGTPLFRIDGKTIPLSNLVSTIEQLLAE